MEDNKLKIESRLAQIGSVNEPVTGAVNFPIYQSTAFRHPKLGQSTGFDYIRTTNPTRKVLEEAAAALESGDAGFACSSGMAALQTIFAMFGQGDHLIVSRPVWRYISPVGTDFVAFRCNRKLCRYERSGSIGEHS